MAIDSLAVCWSVLTEIDQWLFWQTKITGVLNTPAKFIATWKSADDVAPSPRNAITTASSFLIFEAHAAPTACGSCVPMQDDQLTWFTDRAAWCDGICRPLVTSPELPNTCAMYGTSGKPRSSIAAASRRAGKIQSVGRSA